MKIQPKNLILIAVLIIIGSAIYAFNLNNPLFWDDTDWIINNPFVHEFSWENLKNWFTKNTLAGIGLKSNYYRPFLFFTFTLNYVLDGVKPLGYHLMNNGLHIANALLVFVLFGRVFKNRFVSFFTALFFLVHPLQTEAVTYIAGRGDPLNVFFMLLALLAFWEAERRGDSWRQWRRFVTLPLLFFALASRETAIIFPFLLLVFYIAFISPTPFWKGVGDGLKRAWPYFALVFVYGILRLTMLNFDNTLNFYSGANPYTESFSTRMYTFLGILLTYGRLIAAPTSLHMERSAVVYASPWFWQILLPFTVIAAILVLLVRLSRKQWLSGQLSDARVIFFGVGWFFVNLGPTSGITPVNALLYEHWLYLALVGPFTVALFYLERLFRNAGRTLRGSIFVALGSAAIIFSFLSIERNRLWGDPIRFFEDILRYEPQSVRINNNLGNLFYNRGDHARAEEYYWQAVSIEDAFPQPHFNLGTILEARKDIRGAVVEFQKAIEIDPDFPFAYQHLAIIYAQQGNLPLASEMLRKLVELTPHDSRVYLNLAKIELVMQNPIEAIELLKRGLKFAESDPEAFQEISDLLRRLGQEKNS